MSRSSSAAVNQVLTNYAQGVAQDIRSALAEFLAPTVRVPGGSGQYKSFDDANAFAVYDTSRPIGGDANRIKFNATDAFYNCAPQALEVTVDMKERENAGLDNALAQALLDQGKIRALINATTLSRDKKTIDYIVANTTAIAQRGNWSNADIDPIDQLNEKIAEMVTTVGSSEFLRLALGVNSWLTLRSHPKVKARCTGVQISDISIEQLGKMLLFPVEIKVGVLGYSTTKAPKATAKTSIIGDSVILTMAVPNPTEYDPSGFKTFTTGQGRIDAVRTYTPPGDRYDVHAADWSEDVKKTGDAAVCRWAIT